MGRLITVISIFIGLFIVSLIIVSLHKISSFDKDESNSYRILKNLDVKNEMKNISQMVIKYTYILFNLKSTGEYGLKFYLYKRKLIDLKKRKLMLIRKIKEDSYLNRDDRVQEISDLCDDNLQSISESIGKLTEYRNKLRNHLEGQRRQLKKISLVETMVKKMYRYK
jgi:hypothetical protein